MTLVPVDTTNALAVSDYLDNARQWLATAVEMTGPAEIALARAEIATAAEAAKQLNLSKGIREDATEMVRRAEYAVSRAIRKGQEDGTIRTQGKGGGASGPLLAISEKLPGATDFAPDLYYNGSEIAALGEVAPEEFEQAIEDAKTEGNLSRANVVRKVRGQRAQAPAAPSVNGIGTTRSPAIREQRADLIADLAAQGYSSRQMPAKVGVTEETVREIARTFGIEIPADRTSLKTRRINPAEVVENTATALEGLAMGIGLIDCKGVEPALASQWVDSLTESMRALNRFVRQLKEQTQ